MAGLPPMQVNPIPFEDLPEAAARLVLETSRLTSSIWALESMVMSLAALAAAGSPDPLMTVQKLRELAADRLDGGELGGHIAAARESVEQMLAKVEAFAAALPSPESGIDR